MITKTDSFAGFDSIKRNFLAKAEFSAEELDAICSRLILRNVKKRKTILSEGSIPQYVIFIVSGLLRMFTTDSKGDELTVDFGVENTWMADLEAFHARKSATVSIAAIENAQVLMLHHDDVLTLHQQIPGLREFSRVHAEEKYNEAMERLKTMSHPAFTAEQRINYFRVRYPNLVGRIPSHMIASYLGISPETLSRIKRSLTNT